MTSTGRNVSKYLAEDYECAQNFKDGYVGRNHCTKSESLTQRFGDSRVGDALSNFSLVAHCIL